jgi:hypothetical protein
MQITNINGTRSVADRIPDMVEIKDPVSEKIVTAKRHNGGFYEILITYIPPRCTFIGQNKQKSLGVLRWVVHHFAVCHYECCVLQIFCMWVTVVML